MANNERMDRNAGDLFPVSLCAVRVDSGRADSALSVLVVLFFILFYNKIFAVTFEEDFAKATGTKAEVYNLLIAVIIVLAMNLVGSLLYSRH